MIVLITRRCKVSPELVCLILHRQSDASDDVISAHRTGDTQILVLALRRTRLVRSFALFQYLPPNSDTALFLALACSRPIVNPLPRRGGRRRQRRRRGDDIFSR